MKRAVRVWEQNSSCSCSTPSVVPSKTSMPNASRAFPHADPRRQRPCMSQYVRKKSQLAHIDYGDALLRMPAQRRSSLLRWIPTVPSLNKYAVPRPAHI